MKNYEIWHTETGRVILEVDGDARIPMDESAFISFLAELFIEASLGFKKVPSDLMVNILDEILIQIQNKR